MPKQNDATGWYAQTFKNWPKQAGTKPTAATLAAVHALGLRPGKQALANAMYLRDGGATTGQVSMVCGAPQLNRMRNLRDDLKLVTQVPTPKNSEGHTVYKMALTAKGTAAVKAGGKAEAAEKPVTPKAPRKPRAAKVDAPAAVPVLDQPQPDAQA